MASGKTTTKKTSAKSSSKSSSKSSAKRGRPSKKETEAKRLQKERELRARRRRATRAVVLFVIGVFLTVLAFVKDDGAVWLFMRQFIFGMLGMMAYLLGPVFIILGVICASSRKVDAEDAIHWSLLALTFSALTYVFSIFRPSGNTVWDKVKDLYMMGVDEIGAGVISIVLGYPLDAYFGSLGGKITAVILFVAAVMLVTETTPVDAVRLIIAPFKAVFSGIKKADEASKERRRLEYERSISLETLRKDESFQEKARRIDVPMAGEKRGPKKQLDIPLDGEVPTSFVPAKEKQTSDRIKKLPSIDVDLGPDFDPTAEGVELNPTGPAAEVVLSLREKEKADKAQNDQLFANFNAEEDDRSISELKDTQASFDRPRQDLEEAAKNNAEDGQTPIVDAEVAALAKKADNEYLKNAAAEGTAPTQTKAQAKVYKAPPISLLQKQINKDEKSIENELSQNAELLVNTLDSFNVHTKVVDISRGPTVTRYELQPETGVRVSRIAQLSDDIALNMAAMSVRIEAPIPGKAAVGIEIPNKITQTVNLRPVIESEEFQKSKGLLTFALGKDVSGAIKVGDMEKMPHLLIAGATGMGKSVCINSIIISLIYRCSPEELKLILVDPKMVEFTAYNGLPHLYLPVVTEAAKAAGALGWAVCEMLKRYRRFSATGCRNITEYNKYVDKLLSNPDYEPEEGEEEPVRLPRVVIIIDELADLMMAAPNEVEDAIARLAQMARAAGMHLILATQRPSVDVITGVIKNNIPSRIALAVSSQVDSRTILDGAGAEKLLGRGDMLYMPVGQTKSTRIQGCFVTDEEVAKVVKYVKDHNGDVEYDDKVIKEIEEAMPKPKTKGGASSYDDDGGADDGRDPMFEEAVSAVLDAGAASTSMLQRKLRLGYGRAARIIDEMEEMGIISPQDGSKPRKVLISKQGWMELMNHRSD